ncbi:MAG: hypothetical protein RDU25_02525 [Patescibacteria group bacterium]|nr:hypothetical protein [Patescibacteria group bacterium]
MPSKLGDGIIGHSAVVRILESALGNPAPCYLLSGQSDLGKHFLAERFVRLLLGLENDDAHWKSHPDLNVLETEEGKMAVSVEQVRELREKVSLRPMRAPRTVTYIPCADRLNESGNNALLKIIEEPPADAVFVLVAEDTSRIPSTVKSRAVILPFNLVPSRDIEAALVAQGHAAEQASLLAKAARGRPALAFGAQGQKTPGYFFVRRLLDAPNIGARLVILDEVGQVCESAEDSSSAWREILNYGMQELATAWPQKPLESTILAIGLMTAWRYVGTAVSPRLMLDSAAVKLSSDLRKILPKHFSSYLPQALPAILS